MKKLLKQWFALKPIPRKQAIYILMMIFVCFSLGCLTGYVAATGTLPTFSQSESIAPLEATKPSLIEVQTILRSMPERNYEFGYNCVDFAEEASRALAWQGYSSTTAGIEFDIGPNHALLLVPTTDEGWIFIDPQAGLVVRPVVDGILDGRTITAIRILKMVWIPVDEFSANPMFEEIK